MRPIDHVNNWLITSPTQTTLLHRHNRKIAASQLTYSKPCQLQAMGLSNNDKISMGGICGAALNAVCKAFTYVAHSIGKNIISLPFSYDQATKDELLFKKQTLLAKIALVDTEQNSQKGSGSIRGGYKPLNLSDIRSRLRGNYNPVTGVFEEPVSGIRTSILNSVSEKELLSNHKKTIT